MCLSAFQLLLRGEHTCFAMPYSATSIMSSYIVQSHTLLLNIFYNKTVRVSDYLTYLPLFTCLHSNWLMFTCVPQSLLLEILKCKNVLYIWAVRQLFSACRYRIWTMFALALCIDVFLNGYCVMVEWAYILCVNVEYILIHFLCFGLFLTTQIAEVKEVFRFGALQLILK